MQSGRSKKKTCSNHLNIKGTMQSIKFYWCETLTFNMIVCTLKYSNE